MNPYDQVMSIAYDDDDSTIRNESRGTYIDLPFLLQGQGYDWSQYITQDRSLYNKDNADKVSVNFLPQEGSIQDVDVNNHMEFIPLLPTDENYSATLRYMELKRQGIHHTVSCWLKQFIVYCAQQVGITYPERPIRNWNDFMDYIERYQKTRDDAMLVMKALIISFDYVPSYRVDITTAICIQYNLHIKRKKNDTSRNFCEKIVTHRHNLIRLQVNAASILATGYKYHVIRPPRKSSVPELEERTARYFSEWMLSYRPDKMVKQKKTTKTRRRKTRRSGISTYSTKGNEIRTKEEIEASILEVERAHEVLLAELEAVNTKSDAKDATEDEDDEFVDEYEEDDVPSVALHTQTLTQMYPQDKSKTTPVARTSPRLKQCSPLLGQYSEIEEETKTDDEDIIFLKTESPGKKKPKSTSKRSSPQELHQSPKRSNGSSSKSNVSPKRSNGSSSKSIVSPKKSNGSSSKSNDIKNNRNGSPKKSQSASKYKREHNSDSDGEDSDDSRSDPRSGSRGSRNSKRHSFDDTILSAMKRQIYKDILYKQTKKKRSEESDSDSDDVKHSKKKPKKSIRINVPSDSYESSSSSDGVESSHRKKKHGKMNKKNKSNKESDSSDDDRKPAAKKLSKKHKSNNKKSRNDDSDSDSSTKDSKPPSKKTSSAKKVVIQKKPVAKKNVINKKVAASKKTTKKDTTKSSVIVLKELKDKKEKNSRTLTQMYPRNKGKSNTNVQIVDDCVYDIKAYDRLPYTHNDGDKTDDDITPVHILNLRKGKGWKLEFFVQWSNNCCEWVFVHGIINVLPEETEHFMSTYGLDYSTCGYSYDPHMEKKVHRLHCDFEPLATTKLKPIAGATRAVIDYEILSMQIYEKLSENIRFIANPTSGSLEILTTPTKKSREDENEKDDNDDENEKEKEDEKKSDDESEDYLGRGLEQRDNVAWRESKNDYDDSGFYK